MQRGLSAIAEYLVWKQQWLVGANPFYCNFWANWPCWSENANFQSIFARSASAVPPSEKRSTKKVHYKLFNELIRINILRCPRGSETQNGRFPCKIAIHFKEVCLCEHCQHYGLSAKNGLRGTSPPTTWMA